MLTSIVAGVSLLLASAAALPMTQVTRLDTFAKRNFAAALAPQLSSNASIIFPQDARWFNTTSRWNDYLTPTFTAAVSVHNEQDIINVVRFATAHNMSFFAQGGGHGYGPMSAMQNAIQINMENLNHVSIDSQTGMATIGGGITYIEFIRAAFAAGREYPVGSCPCVGMTGAGLGGGIGRLQGLHGLSIDAFRRYRVILANGTAINVSREENGDLFWGMRGAGHNFGIVVESEVMTYPQHNNGMYYDVDMVFEDHQLESIFELMNTLIPNMPPEIAYEPGFAVDPVTLNTSLTVNIVYSGNMSSGRQWAEAWRALGPVSFSEQMISWQDLPNGAEGGAQNVDCGNGGLKDIYSVNMARFDLPTMRSLYTSLGDFVRQHPNANMSRMIFETYPQQGVRAQPIEDSAFPGRNNMAILPILFGWWDNAALTSTVDSWLSGMRNQLNAVSGYDQMYLYQNYARSEPAQAYYGYEPWRLERLQDLKRRYDPTNQFFSYHPIPM